MILRNLELTFVFWCISQYGALAGLICILKTSWFRQHEIIELCNLSLPLRKRKTKTQQKILHGGFVLLVCGITYFLQNILGICTLPRHYIASEAYKLLQKCFDLIFGNFGVTVMQTIRNEISDYALTWVGRVVFSIFVSFAYVPLTLVLYLALTLRHLVDVDMMQILDDTESISPSKVLRLFKNICCNRLN